MNLKQPPGLQALLVPELDEGKAFLLRKSADQTQLYAVNMDVREDTRYRQVCTHPRWAVTICSLAAGARRDRDLLPIHRLWGYGT